MLLQGLVPLSWFQGLLQSALPACTRLSPVTPQSLSVHLNPLRDTARAPPPPPTTTGAICPQCLIQSSPRAEGTNSRILLLKDLKLRESKARSPDEAHGPSTRSTPALGASPPSPAECASRNPTCGGSTSAQWNRRPPR